MSIEKTETVNYFTVIDIDRTLLRSDVFVQVVIDYFCEYARGTVAAPRLRSIQQRIERGETIQDVYGQMIACLQSAALALPAVDGVVQRVHERYQSVDGNITDAFVAQLMVPDALRLLAAAQHEPDANYGLVTYGDTYVQQLKIGVLGAITEQQLGKRPPAMIIAHEHKARMIAIEWFDTQRQQFMIPAALNPDGGLLYARSVRLIDDKQTNLTLGTDAPQDAATHLACYQAQADADPTQPGSSLAQLIATIW